nr:AFG1-like ATPase isoform X1 [Tanacetum cinerariifolium]
MTNELRVVAYGVVAWTQRGVPTVTNIAVTNEDVGSSKGGPSREEHMQVVLPTILSYEARNFHALALDGVLIFGLYNRTKAYRLITLVDVMYENKARLFCTAEGTLLDLFERIVTGCRRT